MKVVDEKGKIFGKLNIIDLLVILLLIVAVALVGYKVLRHDGAGNIPGTTLTYTVEVDGVAKSIYEEVKSYLPADGSGDQLMANGALLDAYVTDVTAVPHVNYGVNDAGQATVSTEQNGRLDLTFTIKANVINTITNEVGTQEVRTGKTHIVKTTHFEFINGTILSCDWSTPAEG